MAYLHIENLYKNQAILMFKECYALEKVHGTSAHVSYKDGVVRYFSGGAKHENFLALFDDAELAKRFKDVGAENIVVYGEAYGGAMQGMRATYGDKLQFIVFDVKIGGAWLSVPAMEKVATAMGLEVVPWSRIDTTIEAIDAQRDLPSVVGERRGNPGMKAEGTVLRPLIELTGNNGSRIIAKHKRDDFRETKTHRVVSEADLAVLTEAKEIAEEWVTPMRLTHVIDTMGGDVQMEHMGDVIRAMLADIEREAEGEIIMSRAARKAISSSTVQMFKTRLQETLAGCE